ncbi:DNA polymerase III subunit gamma/tau [Fodinisporobacter ferrooxydans]|uniref:DNA-directed DNA polymerase n=1 Tax=Fodinisporobacter ferrooxydans TaxID=2901836 RepID=A0ABY4CMR3_9BACL|nr:DNA polymerase III subunit gamma/tau [Alicyclobacillaceae bacterium MYW30-H2]
MSYVALYREWRPQTFADMVGQAHIKTTLQNAIRYQRLAHAYLFSGPRGTGKTSTAKIFAKAINCEHGPAIEPCNSCPACRGITDGSIMDVVEIDAASNRGIEEIRDLREQVKYAPTEVRYKVYIIDEVHMLTTEAFNALLKTLEEPPRHVIFILATTEPHKLPATILSRCQRFDFRRIGTKDIVERLKQVALDKHVQVEEQVYWLIARMADGGMRDALSLFDQVISFDQQMITIDAVHSLLGSIRTEVIYTLFESIVKGDTAKAVQEFSNILQSGKDPSQCIHELLQVTRDVLMLKTVPDLPDIQERIEYDPAFSEFDKISNVADISFLMEQLTALQSDLKWNTNPRLMAEVTIVRLAQRQIHARQDIWERIQLLERKIEEFNQKNQQLIQSLPLQEQVTPSLTKVQKTNQSETPPGSIKKPVKQRVPGAIHSPSGTSQEISSSGTHARMVDSEQWNPTLFQSIRNQWPQILEEVKRRKITAQAWLLDGEPVAVAGHQLLAAFKNQIHRETVMKTINKSVIDEVLTQAANTQLELVALSQGEWKQLQQKIQTSVKTEAVSSEREEDFFAGHADQRSHTVSDPSKEPEWIEKTKELFGHENVLIIEQEEI